MVPVSGTCMGMTLTREGFHRHNYQRTENTASLRDDDSSRADR